MSSYDDLDDNKHSSTGRVTGPVTIDRLVNICLMPLFVAAIILHVVCLSVLAAKHEELKDKFSGDGGLENVEKSCILFVDYDVDDPLQPPKWVNNKCHLVIYGSGTLAGCALLMIIFLAIRTLLFKKNNVLFLLDAVEVLLTGLFAGVLAVIVTLGKNETCKSLEDATAHFGYPQSCSEFYITSTNNNRKAQIYQAMRIAQVTSWLAVGVIGLIGVVTAINLLFWLVNLSRRRANINITINAPLVAHDQLEEYNHPESLPPPYGDDGPLPS